MVTALRKAISGETASHVSGSWRMRAALRRQAAITLLVWAIAFEMLAAAYALPSGPTARLAVDEANPFVGQVVMFDASASTGHDDGNGQIAGYRFDFGDGASTDWQGSPAATHAYADFGVFATTVTVRDGRGYEDQASLTLTVRYRPPIGAAPDLIPIQLSFAPAVPQVGDNVTVTVTVLNAGNATAETVTVRIMDFRPDGNLTWIGNFSLSTMVPSGGKARFTLPPFAAMTQGNHTIRVVLADVSPAEASVANNQLDVVLVVLPAGTHRNEGIPFTVDPLVVALVGAGVASLIGALLLLLRPRPPRPLEPPPPMPPDRSPPPIWPP